MRLIGLEKDGTRFIGDRTPDGVRVIAPISEFFQDPFSWLGRNWDDPIAESEFREVPPIPATAKVFCVGLNYRAHAAEASAAPPPLPVIFGRWASTLVSSGSPVPVLHSEGLDWEGEFAVVIGAFARQVRTVDAADLILAWTLFNDLSARTYQLATSQWTLGKNADASAPIGPELVTPDEIGDVTDLVLETRVNGEVVQRGASTDMIFSAEDVISYISGAITLSPGDVIALGTPSGVGWVRKPPMFLAPSDVVEVSSPLIGVLTTPIVTALEPLFSSAPTSHG